MMNHEKITRAEFYKLGGFANTRCVRVTRSGRWAYYLRPLVQGVPQ